MPMRKSAAKVLVGALRKGIPASVRVPKSAVFNGTHFTNRCLQEYLHRVGVEQYLTAQHPHQECAIEPKTRTFGTTRSHEQNELKAVTLVYPKDDWDTKIRMAEIIHDRKFKNDKTEPGKGM